jgi:NADPH:quinone reductase-like Zn-dependent oxidoreductase
VVRAAQIQPGETILIVGARGAVGQAATQIAAWKGAHVIGADRTADPIHGAAASIDTTTQDLTACAFDLTVGRGVDAVFDAVGGPMFEPALRSLRHGGRHVAITSTGETRVTFDLVEFYHNESRLIGVDSNHFTTKDVAEIAEALRPGFERHELKPPAVETVPFDRAITAYEDLDSGKTHAKIVLVFS